MDSSNYIQDRQTYTDFEVPIRSSETQGDEAFQRHPFE